ncbi:hypothetical protein DV736_g2210, partial [Chaetothyriales sp. CBS 134916]
MNFDIFTRRKTHFVLWAPGQLQQAPLLILGRLDPGIPATFQRVVDKPLQRASGDNAPFLWELPCDSLGLKDGVYHYWFKVNDTSPSTSLGEMLVTDPLATAVDYRLLQSRDVQPASVIKVDAGKLVPCDPSGDEIKAPQQPRLVTAFAPNNQLVIYELPTSWSNADRGGRDIGTFKDVLALLQQSAHGVNFSAEAVVSQEAILAELGINALELLPTADSKARFEWGYAPANYFAPDYDLGGPEHEAATDLIRLVELCHAKGIRLISDIVMAFGYEPYAHIDYMQFHLRPAEEQGNPDAWQSKRTNQLRDAYGGESWRYIRPTKTYDPQSGQVDTITPAWAFHRAHLAYWMSKFQLGGLRLDSLNNVANWDFIAQFREDGYDHFERLYPSPQNTPEDRDARFLVVGEELDIPVEMITRSKPCVDALWNDQFEKRVRAAIVGQPVRDENFEWTVRKMIDCRLIDLDGGRFSRGVNAVNYITSHDTEGDNDGWPRERVYNFLQGRGISDADKEQRTKLAFACLLTAVGIPMIFAGEEFCDMSDQAAVFPYKERDPVNWSRKNADLWRTRLFKCVARLVALRKRSPALAVDDASFIHFDFTNNRQIVAWVRGKDPDKLVVTVANFSGETPLGSEYVVDGFPSAPSGMKWRDVMQEDSSGPTAQAGKETLGPWDAKVYELYRP